MVEVSPPDVINYPGSDRVLVPVQLRSDGTIAQMLFPSNLTRAEAEKLSRVILAYAVEERGDGQD